MPKPAKPIYTRNLYEDMKSFYHSKSIRGQKLKRHLKETQKIIDYHSYHNQKILNLDLLYDLTKEIYLKGLLDTRGIYLKTVYLIIEFSELNLDTFNDKRKLFDEMYQKFIKEWCKTHSEDALPTIKSIMNHFLIYLYFNDIHDLKELKFSLIEKYISYMHTINKNITVYDNITKLRRILSYLFHMGYTDQDLSQYLYGLKAFKNERLPDQYSIAEINILISSVKHENEEGKRKYAIVMTAALLGIRAIDISRIKISNIDWNKRQLKFHQNKTKTELTLELPQVLYNAYLDYLSIREDIESEYLLTPLPGSNIKGKISSSSISRIIHEVFIASEIKIDGRKSYAHVLRHSMATHMINNNITMPVVSKILGHSSVETTKHYARISLDKLRVLALEVPLYE